MKVREILETGNYGPADDMSINGPYNMNRIEGPYDISTPNPEQEEDSEDEDDGERLCSSCNGTGEGQYDGSRCYACKGWGVIKPREEPDPDYLRDKMIDDKMTGDYQSYADDKDFD